MDGWEFRLADILRGFDLRAEPFDPWDVWGALTGLEVSVREDGDIPLAVRAEVTAFSLGLRRVREEAGQTNPLLDRIDAETIDYWACRARQVSNPLLTVRYAELVWHFGPQVPGPRSNVEVARVVVDATIEIAVRNLDPNQVESMRRLEWAHVIATSINDAPRVASARRALLDYERRAGLDQHLGIWGRSFDLLLGERQRFPVPDALQTEIVADLEARLARLAAVDDPERLDPHAVEPAALRLASHYRRRGQAADVQRVMGILAEAGLRKVAVQSGLLAAGSLRRVYERLLRFGLRAEAEAVATHYRQQAERARAELPSFTVSTSLPAEEVEAYLREMTAGGLDEVFARLVVHFLPRRADAERQVHETAERHPLLALFGGTTIVDHEGRDVAAVGSADRDLEGNIARVTSERMSYASLFLRLLIERLVSERGVGVGEVMGHLSGSPAFDPGHQPIVEAGLRAYLARDWLVAIHLFVPQIENTLRRLVRMSGGSDLNSARNSRPNPSGGLALRLLDDLLRDERATRAVTPDGAAYLRILLTDPRGWNVRNNVCHGLTPIEEFGSPVADRLFHALLLLGGLRAATGLDEHDDGTLAEPPAVSESNDLPGRG